MEGFRFNPEANKIKLEIEGHKYTIDPLSPAIVNGVAEFQGMKFENISTPGNIEKYTDALIRIIDCILGPGEYEKLRAERDLGLLDLLELGTYILNAYQIPRLKKIAEFLGTPDGEAG